MYRSIKMDSSSSLKEFSLDKRKYRKKYILNEKIEETDNKAATTGRIVETLLLEPDEFDNRFYLSACISAPTGLMLAFVDSLYKFTQESIDESGNIFRDFTEIAKDAYKESGFKIKFDAVLAKFIGSDSEIYYREMREVKARGLTVVVIDDVNNAEKIVAELKNNKFTSEIINLKNNRYYEVHNQLQIEGYIVDNHMFKSMMDKLIIDHRAKTIQVYDLKCIWAVEGFYEEYYLYRRSYIQAYLYYKAAESLKTSLNLSEYVVLFPKFIVCDSINYYSPLIYTLNSNDIEDAYNGFEHKGKKYPGIKELINSLKWAIDNDVWNMSKKNYLNNGLVNIKN